MAGVPRFQQEQERGEYLPACAGVLRHGIRTQGMAVRLPVRPLAKETELTRWSVVEGRLGVCVHSRGVLTAEIETPEPGTAATLPISKPGVGWLNSTIPRSKRLCAHCGASSMSASAVALVVFDLDACCWYPEMYQLWVRGQIANPGLRTHVHGSRYKGATPCHSVSPGRRRTVFARSDNTKQHAARRRRS